MSAEVPASVLAAIGASDLTPARKAKLAEWMRARADRDHRNRMEDIRWLLDWYLDPEPFEAGDHRTGGAA